MIQLKSWPKKKLGDTRGGNLVWGVWGGGGGRVGVVGRNIFMAPRAISNDWAGIGYNQTEVLGPKFRSAFPFPSLGRYF